MRTFSSMGTKLPRDIFAIVVITLLVKVSMAQERNCPHDDRRVAVAVANNEDYLEEDCTERTTSAIFCRFTTLLCQINCLLNRYSGYTCTAKEQCICHGIGGPEDTTRGDLLCSYSSTACEKFCSLTLYAAYNCTENNQCVCLAADGSPTRGDIFCSYKPSLCRTRCQWTNYMYFECDYNNRCLCSNTMPEYPNDRNETDYGNGTDPGNETYTTIGMDPEPDPDEPDQGKDDLLCKIPALCKYRCKLMYKLDFTCRYNRVCRCRGKKDSAPKGDKTCRYWKFFCKLYCFVQGLSGRCTRKDQCECYNSEDEDGDGEDGGGGNGTAPATRDMWCRWPNACKLRCMASGFQKYTCETKRCLCHAKGARPDIPDTAVALVFASDGQVVTADTVCGPYAELVKTCWFYCLVFRMSYIGMCDDDSQCMC